MQITQIRLRDFRNYQTLSLPLSPGVNVLYGANAQGKTNILEAVYLCCLGRSHRTAHETELIRQGERSAYANVQVARRDGPRSVEVLLENNERKRIQVSGMPIRRMSELMGHVQCILFSPEDLQLVKGGPSLRRRFLDTSLSQLRPAYFLALAKYNAALAQRNALLKRGQGSLDAMLDAFDVTLSEYGAQVIRDRMEFVQALAPLAAQVHQDVAEGETLCVKYKTQIEAAQSDLQAALMQALQKGRTDDLRRAVTLTGPHRDDILLEIAGKDARSYASQGQQRTAALSLKLAGAEQMQKEMGQAPVLMLDDVFSELDSKRQHALLSRIHGQALLKTATETPRILECASLYQVREGQVERQK